MIIKTKSDNYIWLFLHKFRYACEVCSHVSRSKDALRKHVSYRHPGAPSPCETEAKRKRTKAAAAAKLQHDLALLPSTSQYAHQMTLQQQLQAGQCFTPDPPSYPGQPLSAHHQPSMGHTLDLVKSEPTTPTNSTGSQTPSQRDPSTMHSSTMLSTTTVSGSTPSDQQSGSHMSPSTTSATSNVSQTQHLNQQLPQCQ